MTPSIKSTVAATLLALCGVSAFAQASVSASQQVIQREVNQQQRVENGLRDGSLTSREAAKIERGESNLARTIARDEAKGPLTKNEERQINHRENALSSEIGTLRTNDRTGNPASASSRRMQADVQRDVNQEKRIEAGVRDGQLTHRDVASLERGQARADAQEAHAARDGHVGKGEQRRIQRTEKRQSQRIHHDRKAG